MSRRRRPLPSYGEGIAYWPLVEVLKQLNVVPSDVAAAASIRSLLGRARRVLCALGRYDEAELLAQSGRELGHHEDSMTQQTWRQTQALAHSARGQHVDAERLAREAVNFSLRTDPH